jgi:ABC-2 type transport system permease protein
VSVFPNAFHVARREYLFRVRGRAFIITTVLLGVAVAAITLVPTILGALGVDEPPEVAVLVEADGLRTDPVVAIGALLSAGTDPDEPAIGPRVTRVDDAAAAEQAVRDGEFNALLKIARGTHDELVFEYLTGDGLFSQTRQLVIQAANALAIDDRLARAGITEVDSAALFAPAPFAEAPIDPDDARTAEDFGGAYMLAYALVILTFMAILTYGNWVAQSVAEEKSGRVMELLITAATPRQLLTGKILGAGAAGLTQYVVIIGAVVIGFLASSPLSDALGVTGELPVSLPQLDALLIVPFGAFFVLGFLLYSTLYAAAGSMVSRIEDVQQAVGPLIFLALGGYFASFAALNAPDADWVRVLSFIPFFSPYLMPARMLLAAPSGMEVAAAIGVLALTVIAAIWVAARIYSAGVLLYGQRPGIRTVLRATRVAR